jgi:hypothetical protein
VLLRQVQKLRDRTETHHEIHFSDVTKDSLPFYLSLVDLVAASDAEFSCFVVDRKRSDPVARFGSHWKAYAKLSEQLLVGTIRPRELLVVLADDYSTPDDVVFEKDVRAAVNKRLKILGVVGVCRLDSRSTDGLQIADLLTSAVAFEFRQQAKMAGRGNPKASLAERVRAKYGVASCLGGCKVARLNIEVYGVRKRKTRGKAPQSRTRKPPPRLG